MGRSRTRQKKSCRTTSASATTSSFPSIPSLLAKAQDLIVQCDYPLARKFTERVLAREDATSTEKNQAREMLAVVLLEIGDVDDAKEACRPSIARYPLRRRPRSSLLSCPLIQRLRRPHRHLHISTSHNSQTTHMPPLHTTNLRLISCRLSLKENLFRLKPRHWKTRPKSRETSSAPISAW